MAESLFMTVDNFKMCVNAFKTFMFETYNIEITRTDPNMKKRLYEVMLDVSTSSYDGMSLKEMNNMALNHTRNYYVKTLNLNKEEGVHFGSRPVSSVQLRMDEMSSSLSKKAAIDSNFKRIESERNYSFGKQEKVPPSFEDINKPIKEKAFDVEEFNAKIDALKNTRDVAPSLEAPQNAPSVFDSKEAKEAHTITDKVIVAPLGKIPDLTSQNDERLKQDIERSKAEKADPKVLYENQSHSINGANNAVHPQRLEYVIPYSEKTFIMEKYMIVNGFDRDWNKQPERFRVVADVNNGALQERYRNVRSISIKRAIIPQEIIENCAWNHVTKTSFNHSFSFSFPYVLITIDEIANVFDGTNDAVRRSFCQMILDKHYRTANGRGFIVLLAMQDEKKLFYPTPLSGLPKLSISVRKPNGELFNTSRDDYRITKIEYETFNPRYLKIVINKYFDKNEFFKGDTVKMCDYSVTNTRLAEYVNRSTGHDIVEMGQPNQSGFFRTFYIETLGRFDPEHGKFVIDHEAIEDLASFNERCAGDRNTTESGDRIEIKNLKGVHNGKIINMTLQCVFSFKIEELNQDPAAVMNVNQPI